MGTAIRNMKSSMGANSTKIGHKPVRTAAKTPVTTVAKWFPKQPIIYSENFIAYNSNAGNQHLILIKKKKSEFIRLLQE